METQTENTTDLKLFETVGRCCISIYDGINSHRTLKSNINNKIITYLSFKDVEIISLVFLNICIGQLYEDFDSKTLNEYIKICDITDQDKELMITVIENAKKYYSDKDKEKE